MKCVNCGAEKANAQSECEYCGSGNSPEIQVNRAVFQPATIPLSTKKKSIAILLSIFFGYFGVHNFYLGFNKKAIAQLLISVLSCGLFAFGTWIWALVDLIYILIRNKDASGRQLR